MDFFQAQDFFKQMYPGKKISYEFDEKCHRKLEVILTNGNPNSVHHVESHQVKVMVEGMDPVYVPIQPHRENFVWSKVKNILNSKKDVHFEQSQLSELKKCPIEKRQDMIQELIQITGLSKDQIEAKLK